MTTVGHKGKAAPPLTSVHRSRGQRHDAHSDSSQRARRGIPPTIPEDQLSDMAPSSSKQDSLAGSGLQDKAFQVTRRLSMSVYMTQGLQALIARTRGTMKSSSVDTASIQYEPTYRMEPEHTFHTEKVEEAIRDVLEMHLRGREYDHKLAPLWTTHISNELNDRVKMLDMPRYRFVCHVVLGQRQHNNLYMASRCAWDEQRDSYATAEYKTPSLVAIATVHGVYLE